MSNQKPAFLERRWARCTRCLKARAYHPPLEPQRSRCCDAPVKTAAWRGWSLQDADLRVTLATYGRAGLTGGVLPGVPPAAS